MYEELNAGVNYKKLYKDTDVLCLSCMTSNSLRGYELADMFHKNSHARVIMGGMHPTVLPEEAAEHKETERRSSMEIQLEKEAHMPA